MEDRLENNQTTGTARFSQRAQDVDAFLDSFNLEKINLVTDMFANYLTPYEVAIQLNISYSLWMLARETNTDFNEQVLRWETLAIANLHAMAREGVGSPNKFSASAYDRIAQVLDVAFTTKNEHHVTPNDDNTRRGSQQSEFDVQAFLKAHSARMH